MSSNIWNILGIEPTKDKKIIQQAYAEQLKIFHPEEKPEEFKQLQEAYKSAIAYTKRQVVPVNNRLMTQNFRVPTPEIQMPEVKDEVEIPQKNVEPIPDYIAKIKDTDIRKLNEEDIKRYAEILKEQLKTKRGDENLDVLVSMYDNLKFKNIVGLKEFLDCLRKEMLGVVDCNQRVIEMTLSRIERIRKENPDGEYRELIKYLKSKKGLSSVCIAWLCIIAFILKGLFSLLE